MEKEIRHLFERINKSKSGLITKEEFDDYLKSSNLEDIDMIKDKINFQNGGIDFYKFTKLYDRAKLTKSLDIEEAFAILDKDNDGLISKTELANFFERIGIKKTDEQIDQMIQIADTNKDGYVSLEEFKEVLKKCK